MTVQTPEDNDGATMFIVVCWQFLAVSVVSFGSSLFAGNLELADRAFPEASKFA